MTRRAIRENIFLIVFKAAFNSQEDMEEQIRFSVGRIGEPEDDPEDIAVTEAGKVKEEDLAYIDEKSHKIYCNPDASGFINAVLAKVEEP